MSPSQRAICGGGDTAHPGDARWGHPPGPSFVQLFVHLFCNQLEQLGISNWGHTNSAGRFRGRLVAKSSGDTPQSGDARWGHPPGPPIVHLFVHLIYRMGSSEAGTHHSDCMPGFRVAGTGDTPLLQKFGGDCGAKWGHTTLERFNGAGCGPGDTALLHVAGCDHPLGPSTVHHSAFVHKNKHHGKLRITRPTQKHLDTSDRVSPGISVAAESSSGRPVWPRSAALCVPGKRVVCPRHTRHMQK